MYNIKYMLEEYFNFFIQAYKCVSVSVSLSFSRNIYVYMYIYSWVFQKDLGLT